VTEEPAVGLRSRERTTIGTKWSRNDRILLCRARKRPERSDL